MPEFVFGGGGGGPVFGQLDLGLPPGEPGLPTDLANDLRYARDRAVQLAASKAESAVRDGLVEVAAGAAGAGRVLGALYGAVIGEFTRPDPIGQGEEARIARELEEGNARAEAVREGTKRVRALLAAARMGQGLQFPMWLTDP